MSNPAEMPGAGEVPNEARLAGESREANLERLKNKDFRAFQMFNFLKNPVVSRESFLQYIEEFNSGVEKATVYRGKSHPRVGGDLWFEITEEISPTRTLIVKAYETGAVLLEGSDNS